MARPLMLHDGDCGFCQRMAALVPRLHLDVDDAALQDTDLAAYGIDPDRALLEMPFIGRDGRIVYGHHAWAGILATGPLPLRWIGRALDSRIADPVASRAYHWVSTNRHRFPGSTPSCSIEGRSL